MDTVYLDHAATTPLDEAVFAAMEPHLKQHFGNASSVHAYGRRSRVAVEESRERVAEQLGAEPSEIVFTSGGTEADNLALKGVVKHAQATGQTPRLVTSAAEHEAVLRPAERLAEAGLLVTILTPARHGAVTPDQLDAALADETVSADVTLVSLMHANNEIGVMHDIPALAEVCHDHGALLHCDAVQTAGLFALDVKDLGVDLLSMSGHKFYGPKGIGALYVRSGVDLAPLVEGGSQERERRGGTENVAAAVGMAEALERAAAAAEARTDRIRRLQERLVEGLEETLDRPFVLNTPLGDAPVAPHVVNIAFPPDDGQAIDGEMLILNLDMEDVLVSAGSACTSGALEPSHVLTALGLERATASAAIRFSLGKDTTTDEIDYTVDAVGRIVQRMS